MADGADGAAMFGISGDSSGAGAGAGISMADTGVFVNQFVILVDCGSFETLKARIVIYTEYKYVFVIVFVFNFTI